MSRFAGGVGLIPEQDWENPDLPPSPFGTAPEVASIGFAGGRPAGSAAPLTWSAAQFVRLVHDPAASRTSTAASFPQRDYTIAGGSAWSRLLEVQGFGQRYVDADGGTLGAITIRANEISRFITLSVPRSSLGQPGPGWGFTVVLTGQDGFSPDQARGFAPTPQEFAFGSAPAPPATRTAPSTPARSPRRWTCSPHPASPSPTSWTTPSTTR